MAHTLDLEAAPTLADVTRSLIVIPGEPVAEEAVLEAASSETLIATVIALDRRAGNLTGVSLERMIERRDRIAAALLERCTR